MTIELTPKERVELIVRLHAGLMASNENYTDLGAISSAETILNIIIKREEERAN